MKKGDSVRIARHGLPVQWWNSIGKPYPMVVSGTVQKVFKNGKCAVAIDGLKNNSQDGLMTLHFFQAACEVFAEDDDESIRRAAYHVVTAKEPVTPTELATKFKLSFDKALSIVQEFSCEQEVL